MDFEKEIERLEQLKIMKYHLEDLLEKIDNELEKYGEIEKKEK